MDGTKFTQMNCPECDKSIYADKTADNWYCGYCGTKIKITDQNEEKRPVKKSVVKVKLKRHNAAASDEAVKTVEKPVEEAPKKDVKVTFEETIIESAIPAPESEEEEAEKIKKTAEEVTDEDETEIEEIDEDEDEYEDDEEEDDEDDDDDIIDIEEDELTIVDAKPVKEVKPAPAPVPAKPVQEVKPAPAPAKPVQEAKPAPAPAKPVQEVKPAPAPAKPVQEAKPAPAPTKPTQGIKPAPAQAKPTQGIKPAPAQGTVPAPTPAPTPTQAAHAPVPERRPAVIQAAHAPVQTHTPAKPEEKLPEFVLREEVRNDMLIVILDKYNGDSPRVNIPEEVDRIAPAAFKGNTAVQSVTIHDEVKEIGGSCFEDCVNLTEVFLPNTLQRLNFKTFRGCKSLKSITIPASVDDIMNDALDCGVTTITFEDSETLWELEDEYAGGAFNVDRKGTGEGVSKLIFKGVPYPAADVLRSKSIANYLRSQGLCPKCGGKFGVFNKCKGCGFKKNF